MHQYLRAIGFSDHTHHKEIQKLLSQVYDKPDNIEVSDLLDSTFITMEKDFGKDIGIGIFGEYDSEDRFQIEYYYPYFKSSTVSTTISCNISRRTDRYAFSAMCEDYRLGISLIFYLQNTNGYLNCVSEHISLKQKMPIQLSAMSNSGCILLPVRKTTADRREALVTAKKRGNLIESARKGDEAAMESLTMYDIDQFNQAAMRIQREDLYSIVDTSFMPAGMECDQYSVIGDIQEIEEIENTLSHEKIYRFLLECNDLYFNVIINQKDLFGEPAIGRRFKGEIWLQGHIDFPESP